MLTALLCPANSVPGRLVSVFEGGDPIAHVAMDMGDSWAVAEELTGCWARPVEHYGASVIRFPLPLPEEPAARAWLRLQIGRRYSYEQIFRDALHLGATADAYFVCSGLIAEACKVGGWYPWTGRDPKTIEPSDWHRLYDTTVYNHVAHK